MSIDQPQPPTGGPIQPGPHQPSGGAYGHDAQPAEQDAQQAQQAGPPVAKKGGARSLIGLVVVALIAGGVFAAVWFANRDKIDQAEVGDCVSLDESNDTDPYRVVDCADPQASLKVLKLINGGGEECKDVPGASRSSSKDDKEVCMGGKDVDPATAVNAAQEGDCLAVNGDDALKVECGSPKAQYKVLKRLTDVSSILIDRACDDVAGTTASYSWTWQSTGGSGPKIPSFGTDVLLCLQEQKAA